MVKSDRIEGYSIHHPEDDSKYSRFDFDKTVSSAVEMVTTAHHENRMELRTFGAKPYVYYAGNTDYVSIPLHGVFVTEYNENGDITRTALEAYEEFKRVVKLRIPLKVENSIGEIFICDVELTQSMAPLQFAENDMEFIEVNVVCVEIDEIGG